MKTPEEQLYRQFQTVFHTHYKPLCSYAFTLIKNKDNCEDIVQEVFTRIWEDRKDLIAAPSVRFYLFVAVRNNCISFLRRDKRFPIVEWKDEGSSFSDPSPVDPGAGPAHDHTPVLEEAIGRLPPKCREVFTLTRISGMSYRQVAEALEISEKTVENQVGKALKMLRAFLKEKGVYLVWLLAKFIFTTGVGVTELLTLYKR